MDERAVSFDEFRHCLQHLERLNRVSLGYRPTLSWLDEIVRSDRDRDWTLFDIGCGHGDTLRAIRRWSRRRGVSIRLTGIDINPDARRAALLATDPEDAIEYVTRDAFAPFGGPPPDLVVSALFAHHLDDARLVAFLHWMTASARVGWFINDLHRHFVPYWFLRTLGTFPSVDRMVAHDGPVSVARGFVRDDWRRLLRAASIDESRVGIGWYVPFRWGVAWRAA